MWDTLALFFDGSIARICQSKLLFLPLLLLFLFFCFLFRSAGRSLPPLLVRAPSLSLLSCYPAILLSCYLAIPLSRSSAPSPCLPKEAYCTYNTHNYAYSSSLLRPLLDTRYLMRLLCLMLCSLALKLPYFAH